LGCEAAYYGRNLPEIRRNLHPPDRLHRVTPWNVVIYTGEAVKT